MPLDDLPEIGQTSWGQPLIDALNAINETAEAAETPTAAQQKADAAQAHAISRANHTGTQSTDTLTDGVTSKVYTATEKTKLSGVANNATANQSDATLKDRANHSGTQLASTISDLDTAVDEIAAAVVAVRTFDLDTNYASLEDALDALPDYATLEIRGAHSRSSAFTVDKPCTIRFAVGGSITTNALDTYGIDVDSSYVTIVDPNLIGYSAATAGAAVAINAVGTVGDPIDQFAVLGTGGNWASIDNWSKYGIYAEHITNFTLSGLTVANIAYGAIMVESALDGRIEGNTIDTLTMPSGFVNAYGIATSRNSTDSLANKPRSARIVITRNTVKNVTTWEGIDTHAGIDHQITDNTVINCKVGIAIVSGKGTGGTEDYAPLNITVANNIVNGGWTTGLGGVGIVFKGATDGSTVTEYATGQITNNQVIDHGDEDDATSGGYQVYATKGVAMSINRAVRCAPNAFSVYHNNASLSGHGNIIEDCWSTTRPIAVAFMFNGANNTVKLSGNTIVRADKSAAVVNTRGVHFSTSVGNQLIEQGNDFLSTTLPYNALDGVVRFNQRGINHAFVAAIPVRGVWEAGAQAIKTAPAASTSPGWTCVTAGGANNGAWAADTATTAGTWLRSTSGNRVFEAVATTGDTKTHATTEPSWSSAAVGDTFTDDAVTWICRATTLAVFKTMPALGA